MHMIGAVRVNHEIAVPQRGLVAGAQGSEPGRRTANCNGESASSGRIVDLKAETARRGRSRSSCPKAELACNVARRAENNIAESRWTCCGCSPLLAGCHRYPDTLGYGKHFETIVRAWRSAAITADAADEEEKRYDRRDGDRPHYRS